VRQPQTSVSRTRSPARGHGRLRLYANPFRLLFSASLWCAAGYVLTYLLVSGFLFSVALTAATLTAALAVTVALVPLLVASAAVVRGCAAVERARLRQVFRQPVRGCYPSPDRPGIWHRARTAWTGGATWRDLSYLVGLWVPLFALDTIVFALWGSSLAGVTLPLWYRHVSDVCIGDCGTASTPGVLIGHYPNGPHGPGASGLWIYHSVGPALLVAAGCAVAFLLCNYLLVLTARAHSRVARSVLRCASDPLEPARAVLTEPGPLGPLSSPPDS
jgi:hypothetical protein